MTGVSWLSDHRFPPAFRPVGRGGVEDRSPNTVAGPRRRRTGFLFRHHLTGAFLHAEVPSGSGHRDGGIEDPAGRVFTCPVAPAGRSRPNARSRQLTA